MTTTITDVNAHPSYRSTATLYETGLAAMLPTGIRPVATNVRVAGPAFTVLATPGNNIWLHRAVYAARPGDVLVVSTMGAHEFGYWGDILTTAAQERHLAGLVIDGCIRDKAEIDASDFPVFARGLCVRGTGKDAVGGGLDVPLGIGDVTVRGGDYVVADCDGVVVVPAGDVPLAAERAAERDEVEAGIIERLRAGETTLDIYGWPAP